MKRKTLIISLIVGVIIVPAIVGIGFESATKWRTPTANFPQVVLDETAQRVNSFLSTKKEKISVQELFANTIANTQLSLQSQGYVVIREPRAAIVQAFEWTAPFGMFLLLGSLFLLIGKAE